MPEHDTSEGRQNLTRQEQLAKPRSHFTEGRGHRLADTSAVNLGTLWKPSQADQRADFGRA
jgi:hypothetical protein